MELKANALIVTIYDERATSLFCDERQHTDPGQLRQRVVSVKVYNRNIIGDRSSKEGITNPKGCRLV